MDLGPNPVLLSQAPASLPADFAPSATYDVVVIIVNWNTRELLTACLESLATATVGRNIRCIVVDNASSDGSADMVAQRFPGVELHRETENLGFARANNLALERYADRARYLLLLNPDTVVPADLFDRILEFADAHPEAGMVGCRLVKPNGALDWACKRSAIVPSVLFYKAMGLDRKLPHSPRFARYNLTYLDEHETHEVDALVGAFMLVRAECLRQIGLLDPSFFMYGEDLEWCYRAKAAGWKIYYAPVVTVIHHKGQSTGKQSYRMIYHWYHSTWRVYRTHIAPNYSPFLNAAVWAGFHGMCGLSMLANVFRRNKRVPGRY